jgi:hypothetical protein
MNLAWIAPDSDEHVISERRTIRSRAVDDAERRT